MGRIRSWLDSGTPSSTPAGVACAVLLVAACTALIYPLKRVFVASSLDALYIPAVLFVAVKWGGPVGVFAALLSALSFDYFHVAPVGRFTQLLPRDAAVFVAVSAAAIFVANMAQRARLAEQRREEEIVSRARIVAAADEERRRVVRDLHDGAQQRLVHAVIVLKLALRELGGAHTRAAALLDESLEHAEQANHELRELVHGILPSALTRGGLYEGVEALLPRISVPVNVDVTDERFPAGVEATAYFVVSEALTNVVKHAHASSATVSAWVKGGVLHVEVRDDGVGGALGADTTGLGGLKDRVSALGGRLIVESPRGGGTLVSTLLPLSDQRNPSGESRR